MLISNSTLHDKKSNLLESVARTGWWLQVARARHKHLLVVYHEACGRPSSISVPSSEGSQFEMALTKGAPQGGSSFFFNHIGLNFFLRPRRLD